jgi:hypothetical protein
MNKKRGYYSADLGGKKRTLRFNMNFWAEFTDQLGIGLEQLGDVFENGVSLSAIRALIYSALITYDREQGNEIDYNVFTVGSWLDDMDASELEKVMGAMMESKILGNELNMGISRKAEETTEKKTKE